METFTVLSSGIAAALGLLAGVMLVGLSTAVDHPAPAADRQHPAQRQRA